MQVGIHVLVLRPGVESGEFEQAMLRDLFPRAAETPGTVNRGGVSTIKSQHLLQSSEEGKYWWLVKNSEALSSRTTGDILEAMRVVVGDRLDTLATVESSIVLNVAGSFEVGERSALGRPLGLPTFGTDL
jgi:hypothetical protein